MNAQPIVHDLTDVEAVPTRGEALDKLDTIGVRLSEQCFAAINQVNLSNESDEFKDSRRAWLNSLIIYLDSGEIDEYFDSKKDFFQWMDNFFGRLQEQDQWPGEGERNILPNTMGLLRIIFEEYMEAEKVSLNGPFAEGKKSRELGKRFVKRTQKILKGSKGVLVSGGRKFVRILPSKQTSKRISIKIAKALSITALAGGIATGGWYGAKATYRGIRNSAMVEKIQNSEGENDIHLLLSELSGKKSWSDVWDTCREATSSNIGKLVGKDGEEVFKTKSGTITVSTSTDDDKETIKITSGGHEYNFYRDTGTDETMLRIDGKAPHEIKANQVISKLTELSKK